MVAIKLLSFPLAKVELVVAVVVVVFAPSSLSATTRQLSQRSQMSKQNRLLACVAQIISMAFKPRDGNGNSDSNENNKSMCRSVETQSSILGAIEL